MTTTATESAPRSTTPDRDFVLTRLIDAPTSAVFDAWTRPEQLARWWGPETMTATAEIDLRPGGAYRLTMRDDESSFPLTGHLVEIVPGERLVMTMDLSDHPPEFHQQLQSLMPPGVRAAAKLLTTVTFEARGTKTQLTIRQHFETAAERDAFVKLGNRDGWQQSLDKLDTVTNADRTFELSRVLDAPRSLVWAAWTDPKHLAKWWGPNGFTNTYHAFELREGGTTRYTMHGPDGTDYPNRVRYEEVVPAERLTYLHDDDGDGTPPFRVTVSFAEVSPTRTKVTMRMMVASAAVRRELAAHGAVEGGQQTLARLHALLSERFLVLAQPGERSFVLRRIFDAPRELVFEAMTKPEHVARWYGPHGVTLSRCEIDLRVGGAWRYVMPGPDGQEHVFHGVYREIVRPERIVSTEAFDDFPAAVVTTTLVAEGDRTILTSTVVHASVEGRDGHLGSGMETGARETFERLEALARSFARS